MYIFMGSGQDICCTAQRQRLGSQGCNRGEDARLEGSGVKAPFFFAGYFGCRFCGHHYVDVELLGDLSVEDGEVSLEGSQLETRQPTAFIAAFHNLFYHLLQWHRLFFLIVGCSDKYIL